MLKEVPTGPLRLQLGGKATVGRGQVHWLKREV
jgi:CRISPR/Cas system CMR subunit Cmr4 (Cas7 group RAMP superfamily)